MPCFEKSAPPWTLEGAKRPDHNSIGESYFPPWWIANLKKNYPKSWQSICLQQSQRPPLTLRVNRRAISLVDYAAVLQAAQIEAEPIERVANTLLDAALVIKEPLPVASIPGFFDGLVSVQDAGAQLAGHRSCIRRQVSVFSICVRRLAAKLPICWSVPISI
jgi:16S rRNA C967 or C1407 C5-methylase (RsmB/RsmF family)